MNETNENNNIEQNITTSIPTDFLSEDAKIGARYFKPMAIACLIHAICFPFFLHNNLQSIMTVFWVNSLIALVLFSFRVYGVTVKKDSYFVIALMELLGISTFLTGNGYTIFLNYVGLFGLLLVLLLHNFADDSKWDLGVYFSHMLTSVLFSVGRLANPIQDMKLYEKNIKEEGVQRNEKARAIAIGCVAAIPVLFVLGALLMSADAVFDNAVTSLFKGLKITENTFVYIIWIVFGFFASYCGIRHIAFEGPHYTSKEVAKKDATIITTVFTLVLVMYAAFSIIQIMYLFIGCFELPGGISYAEYAHQGFFQLLFVCIINVSAVLLVGKYMNKTKLLNCILIGITISTYIMIISSALRMLMYIKAYGLTYLRISVLVFLAALAIFLVGVLIQIINLDFNSFRYGFLVFSVAYVLFSFAHIDYFIAKYNIANANSSMELDYYYLCSLSSDAAPVIAENKDLELKFDTEYADVFSRYYRFSYCEIPKTRIRNFNLSHFIAHKAIEKIDMKISVTIDKSKLDDTFGYMDLMISDYTNLIESRYFLSAEYVENNKYYFYVHSFDLKDNIDINNLYAELKVYDTITDMHYIELSIPHSYNAQASYVLTKENDEYVLTPAN